MAASSGYSWLPDGELPFEIDPHFQELGRDSQDLFGRLQGSRPEGAFDGCADNIAAWAAIARLDVRPWLTSWFTPVTDWDWDNSQSGRLGQRLRRGCLGLGRRRSPDRSVGVAWTYGGVHDIDKKFNGLPPTGRPVLVRGFTVIGIRDHQLRFWRYIDWIDLYTQLGLTINWRIPVGPPPDQQQVIEEPAAGD